MKAGVWLASWVTPVKSTRSTSTFVVPVVCVGPGDRMGPAGARGPGQDWTPGCGGIRSGPASADRSLARDGVRSVTTIAEDSRTAARRRERGGRSGPCDANGGIEGSGAILSPPGDVYRVALSNIAGSAASGLVASIPIFEVRSEERRVGKEGRSRWSPYH